MRYIMTIGWILTMTLVAAAQLPGNNPGQIGRSPGQIGTSPGQLGGSPAYLQPTHYPVAGPGSTQPGPILLVPGGRTMNIGPSTSTNIGQSTGTNTGQPTSTPQQTPIGQSQTPTDQTGTASQSPEGAPGQPTTNQPATTQPATNQTATTQIGYPTGLVSNFTNMTVGSAGIADTGRGVPSLGGAYRTLNLSYDVFRSLEKPDLQASLNLSPDQKERLQAEIKWSNEQMARIRALAKSDPAEAAQTYRIFGEQLRARFEAFLTAQQWQIWRQKTGAQVAVAPSSGDYR